MMNLPVAPMPTWSDYFAKADAARKSAVKKRASAQIHRELSALAPGHARIAAELEADATVDEAFALTCERWAAEAA